MSESKTFKVVVAGGGTAGWLAAAAFSKLLKPTVSVTLIESDEIGRIGVGEATIPPLRNFLRLLGIDERDFMRSTQSTFKLGIEFKNWSQKGASYIHSFGATGKDCWACDFQHFWLRGQQLGIAAEFGDYCPELQAAKQQKFYGGDKSPLNYAFHLDAGLLAKYLKDFSLKWGARHVEGKICSVNQDADSGDITSLNLEDGQTVDGDLFIDCTGFRAALIEGALHSGYERCDNFLPCNSALAVQTSSVAEPKPYTESIAHEAGWQWRIPLQHRNGSGHVYCDQFTTDEEAKTVLANNLEGEPLVDIRGFKFLTGRRKTPWLKNCVAMGLASGFLEPLESTSIHLAMSSILRLLKLFPYSGCKDHLRDEFNQQCQHEFETIRDFLILHYKATDREDTEFWRYCKHMEIPDSLKHRMELFRESAVFTLKEHELFKIDSWTQVLIGQEVMPQHYHPIVDSMSEAELGKFLAAIKSNTDKLMSQLPSHQSFINSYCPAN